MKKIIIATILSVISSTVWAQTSATASSAVSMSTTNAVDVTFTASGTAAGTTVTLPFATISDYMNGVSSSNQQLEVNSNASYNVTVAADASSFTYVGATSPAPVMPLSGVLKLSVPANATGGTIASPFSSSSYSTITNTAQNLLTNCASGDQLFSIQYLATPGFAYPAGTYTANIIYTVTQL